MPNETALKPPQDFNFKGTGQQQFKMYPKHPAIVTGIRSSVTVVR
jgi:hypothetical protein